MTTVSDWPPNPTAPADQKASLSAAEQRARYAKRV